MLGQPVTIISQLVCLLGQSPGIFQGFGSGFSITYRGQIKNGKGNHRITPVFYMDPNIPDPSVLLKVVPEGKSSRPIACAGPLCSMAERSDGLSRSSTG